MVSLPVVVAVVLLLKASSTD
uniref:Uncharacterized protein n=1 Tax=Arundo donax TaxID=35708 RepID=A0A0A9BDF0_ARUDO